MKPDILVITPTLGNRETLGRTIQSIKEIGCDRVKHVLITPASNISLLKEKYNNIECLAEAEGKKGIYAALNHGFNTYGKAFKYMTFINDDDYWLPDFKVLITEISNNDLDLVYGKIHFVNETGKEFHRKMACSPHFKDFIPLLQNNIILFTQQATLIKSKIFFSIGGFDESYKLVADSKFWAQLSLQGIKYKYVSKECAAYTIQAGQLSSDKTVQQNEHLRLLKEYPIRSRFYKLYTMYKFRIYNLKVYLSRIK